MLTIIVLVGRRGGLRLLHAHNGSVGLITPNWVHGADRVQTSAVVHWQRIWRVNFGPFRLNPRKAWINWPLKILDNLPIAKLVWLQRAESNSFTKRNGLRRRLTRAWSQGFNVVVHKVAAVAIGTDAHRVEAVAHLSFVLEFTKWDKFLK